MLKLFAELICKKNKRVIKMLMPTSTNRNTPIEHKAPSSIRVSTRWFDGIGMFSTLTNVCIGCVKVCPNCHHSIDTNRNGIDSNLCHCNTTQCDLSITSRTHTHTQVAGLHNTTTTYRHGNNGIHLGRFMCSRDGGKNIGFKRTCDMALSINHQMLEREREREAHTNSNTTQGICNKYEKYRKCKVRSTTREHDQRENGHRHTHRAHADQLHTPK
jgi:hypothetical protein